MGEASDGSETVALAEKLQPDVVVMDLAMPRLNGIEATRQITSQVIHGSAVAVLSMHSDESYVLRSLRAGCKGVPAEGFGRSGPDRGDPGD